MSGPTIRRSRNRPARLLRDRTSHYLYVSSIAAYDAPSFTQPGLAEDAPLVLLELDGARLQPWKAESERRCRLWSVTGSRWSVLARSRAP